MNQLGECLAKYVRTERSVRSSLGVRKFERARCWKLGNKLVRLFGHGESFRVQTLENIVFQEALLLTIAFPSGATGREHLAGRVMISARLPLEKKRRSSQKKIFEKDHLKLFKRRSPVLKVQKWKEGEQSSECQELHAVIATKASAAKKLRPFYRQSAQFANLKVIAMFAERSPFLNISKHCF